MTKTREPDKHGEKLVHSRHPAYGCMKAPLTVKPGTDPTAPADPDWAKIAEAADWPPCEARDKP